MQSMTRGETPTFKIYIPSSTTRNDLGTPHVAIAQNLTLIEPTATTGEDDQGEYATFTLTEAQSLRLVSGQNAFMQITWKNGSVVRKGKMLSFWVRDSLIEEVG